MFLGLGEYIGDNSRGIKGDARNLDCSSYVLNEPSIFKSPSYEAWHDSCVEASSEVGVASKLVKHRLFFAPKHEAN